ncbi:19052_t:CDS:2 [Dentiscutata erythropus]|uniref:19052_t:CDS:1 n=1 Tax=Dentiscutata erythropus TaxID=1348616 RepID=A0A9N8VHX1_9GLOM|nr:19052_t:CDS:2 [Dentiscutata erythropus]
MAKYILEQGGVFRDFKHWGTMPLATRTRRHQEYHTDGHFYDSLQYCKIWKIL